jgi:acetylornithine deacetylase/succinyl-diaminopimelate desuccinylase-like protein
MHQTTRLLGELIALPSVNPAFLPAGDSRAGELRVADYVAQLATRAGLEVERQEVLLGRSNILVHLKPANRVTHRVVLAPHMDTVGGEGPGLFKPRIQGGRMYGRGACDTKGSLAAMLTALLGLARQPVRPRTTEIVLAALIDEENAQLGSRTLAASGFEADLVLVGEPTRLRVVTAHKGDVWLELETRGKAAHGARPELGRNAVHAMARVVDLLETSYARQLRQRQHPLLGQPTVNVGTICGGSQPNIVPDRCAIRIDRRALPGETESSVRREIRTLLRDAGLQARIVSLGKAPCPAMETDIELPLVRAFLKAAGQARPLGVDYFCDAAILAAAGMPSLVFGPGDIAQAHTLNEWIAVDQLERGTTLLLKFLQSLP